jgi:hypothetical protein
MPYVDVQNVTTTCLKSVTSVAVSQSVTKQSYKNTVWTKFFFSSSFAIATSGCVNATKRHALRSTLLFVPETS